MKFYFSKCLLLALDAGQLGIISRGKEQSFSLPCIYVSLVKKNKFSDIHGKKNLNQPVIKNALSRPFFFIFTFFLSDKPGGVCITIICHLTKTLTLQVQAETLVIEKNNVANGIVELINQHSITKLVMGMSSFSTYADMQLFIYYNEASS